MYFSKTQALLSLVMPMVHLREVLEPTFTVSTSAPPQDKKQD